jgi:hypothetical protein
MGDVAGGVVINPSIPPNAVAKFKVVAKDDGGVKVEGILP